MKAVIAQCLRDHAIRIRSEELGTRYPISVTRYPVPCTRPCTLYPVPGIVPASYFQLFSSNKLTGFNNSIVLIYCANMFKESGYRLLDYRMIFQCNPPLTLLDSWVFALELWILVRYFIRLNIISRFQTSIEPIIFKSV